MNPAAAAVLLGRLLAVGAFSAMIAAAPEAAIAGHIHVAVSIRPVADIVEKIGAPHVAVNTILPAGASPHTYEPKPKDMIAFSKAELFIMVGAGLDFWVERVARSSSNKARILTIGSELADMLPAGGADSGHGHSHGRPHEAKDPHFWLDPRMMTAAAAIIRDRLSTLYPDNASVFRANYLRLEKELATLDREIERKIATLPKKTMITMHNAWAYFARRYGLSVQEVLIDMPGKEPTPGKIRRIIDTAHSRKVTTFFVEPQFNARAAQVIARDAGMKVVVIDPLGGTPGRERYTELMQFNINQIEQGLR